MTRERAFAQLYESIHKCRKCSDVISSIVPRRLNRAACGSSIVLMAQAPSEGGVRKSGVHWVGVDSRLRRPGGAFLDKYLRRVGYSVDPEATGYATPYTTNVLHCWTGRNGKRDRKPTRNQLENCKQWWLSELQLVMPRVIILLGQPAAEGFVSICGQPLQFKELLSKQGESIRFGQLSLRRYVLPHPTAPYVGKSILYQEVTEAVRAALKEKGPSHERGRL